LKILLTYVKFPSSLPLWVVSCVSMKITELKKSQKHKKMFFTIFLYGTKIYNNKIKVNYDLKVNLSSPILFFFVLRFFVNDKNPTEFYLFACKTFSLDRKIFYIHGKMIKNTPQLTKYFLALADSTDGGKNGEPKKYCFMLFSAQIFFHTIFFLPHALMTMSSSDRGWWRDGIQGKKYIL